MKINPSLSSNNQEQPLQKMKQSHEKAGEIFEKVFLKQMIKEMYKTTQSQEENSIEKDFYQEQMIDILSDKIIESKALNIREKLGIGEKK